MGDRIKIWVPLVLTALALIACGEDTETVQVTDRYTLDMLGKGVSLTEEKCDSARMGHLLYVGDSSSIYYCTGKAWKKANGKDGKDGRDGKDGTDGTDGKRGENGVSGTDCFIEEFAEGFLLGCGATKAVVRYDFEIPDTCSIKRNDDSSYVLTCGKDTTTLLQGPRGSRGATCMQKDVGEGRVNLVCGSDSVTLFRAACGDSPFDPDGLMFCYGDTLVERCNSRTYDIKKQFCYGDTLVDLCDGKDYELTEKFCSGDSIVDLCDGRDYDLSQEFCYGDSIVPLCGGKDYELAQEFCSGDSIVDLCDGRDYDLAQEFCYGDSIVPLCGGKDYDLNLELCQNNEVAPVFCGSKKYDKYKKFCYNDSLVDLCGRKTYDLESQFCYENNVVDLCNGKTFDPFEYICDYNLGMILGRCGGTFGTFYPVDMTFCYGDQVYNLCGGSKYNPKEFNCKDGSTLIGFCGGVEYNPAKVSCYNGEIISKCLAELGESEFCDERNGRVYKYTRIGGQVWMAENLDYRVPVPANSQMLQSFCEQRENDYDLYCGVKGRYYPWHVAMAKDIRVCGEGHSCTTRNPQGYVQGICPDGWHLPFWSEWQLLIQTVGSERKNYWDLSVTDVRYGYFTNPYGFSAVLTGFLPYINRNGEVTDWPSKDASSPYAASYWSSSENWGEIAEYSSLPPQLFVYVVTLDADPAPSTSQYVELRPVLKRNARTVRCVKNEMSNDL